MDRNPDVAVVGAGVVGLAVAYELSRRGARVCVVDPREPGQGATQASAGMLTPHTELLEHRALHALAVRSLEVYEDFVEHVREDAGVVVEHRRCGSLHVASDENQMRGLRNRAAALTVAGASSDLLDAAEVRELEPGISDDVVGGLLVPGHGYVKVADLTRALLAAATARGARLDARRVATISAGPLGLRVETQDEAIQAASVVLAAGSWSSRIAVGDDAPIPVRPVRGQLVQLEWPTAPLARILWGPDCYLVPWATGTVLVGATVEEAGFDERATVAGVHDLLDSACELLPQAWQAGFAGVRVGLRPATPDGLPVIGASPTLRGVWYATGHFRNGVLLAPVTALAVADLVLGQAADPALAAFGPARFR